MRASGRGQRAGPCAVHGAGPDHGEAPPSGAPVPSPAQFSHRPCGDRRRHNVMATRHGERTLRPPRVPPLSHFTTRAREGARDGLGGLVRYGERPGAQGLGAGPVRRASSQDAPPHDVSRIATRAIRWVAAASGSGRRKGKTGVPATARRPAGTAAKSRASRRAEAGVRGSGEDEVPLGKWGTCGTPACSERSAGGGSRRAAGARAPAAVFRDVRGKGTVPGSRGVVRERRPRAVPGHRRAMPGVSRAISNNTGCCCRFYMQRLHSH